MERNISRFWFGWLSRLREEGARWRSVHACCAREPTLSTSVRRGNGGGRRRPAAVGGPRAQAAFRGGGAVRLREVLGSPSLKRPLPAPPPCPSHARVIGCSEPCGDLAGQGSGLGRQVAAAGEAHWAGGGCLRALCGLKGPVEAWGAAPWGLHLGALLLPCCLSNEDRWLAEGSTIIHLWQDVCLRYIAAVMLSASSLDNTDSMLRPRTYPQSDANLCSVGEWSCGNMDPLLPIQRGG